MKANELELAADFLDEYADRLGNDGCNDWDWPKHWTQEERDAFAARATAEDPKWFRPGMSLMNYTTACHLAELLREEAQRRKA